MLTPRTGSVIPGQGAGSARRSMIGMWRAIMPSIGASIGAIGASALPSIASIRSSRLEFLKTPVGHARGVVGNVGIDARGENGAGRPSRVVTLMAKVFGRTAAICAISSPAFSSTPPRRATINRPSQFAEQAFLLSREALSANARRLLGFCRS